MKKFLTLLTTLLISTALFPQEKTTINTYKQITQKEAKEIMDSRKDILILDVRTQDEFKTGHIKGAICIPVEEITASNNPPKTLKDKNQTILVYCRSGRRSKIAAEHLAKLGYTDILEFGGVLTWQFGVKKEH